MAKKIDLEIKLDDVAQKLQALSHHLQQIHTTANLSINCLSALTNYAAQIYQSRLDELESATHLDRDMLNRWCEALATTTTYTRIEAAEHLLHLWQMHFAELRLLAHAGFPLHWVFGR